MIFSIQDDPSAVTPESEDPSDPPDPWSERDENPELPTAPGYPMKMKKKFSR